MRTLHRIQTEFTSDEVSSLRFGSALTVLAGLVESGRYISDKGMFIS